MSMSYTAVMKELKTLGTGQNRKVYARHGIQGPMFGVSYANLGKLEKVLKTDHAMAQRLWKSGNHDARILATKICDATSITRSEIDAWARDLDSYPISGALAEVVARGPHAVEKMQKWTRSKKEWVGRCGWSVLSRLASTDASIDDATYASYLNDIEDRIHTSKNRIRESMNGALIAIGCRSAKLEKQAIAAAKRIGQVEVDHGETGCKTPDAVAYIAKTKAYRAQKASRATSKVVARKTTRSKSKAVAKATRPASKAVAKATRPASKAVAKATRPASKAVTKKATRKKGRASLTAGA